MESLYRMQKAPHACVRRLRLILAQKICRGEVFPLIKLKSQILFAEVHFVNFSSWLLITKNFRMSSTILPR